MLAAARKGISLKIVFKHIIYNIIAYLGTEEVFKNSVLKRENTADSVQK